MDTLGKRLKLARTSLQLSQSQLAAGIRARGYDPGKHVIANIESGRTEAADYGFIVHAAAELHVRPDWLALGTLPISGEGSMFEIMAYAGLSGAKGFPKCVVPRTAGAANLLIAAGLRACFEPKRGSGPLKNATVAGADVGSIVGVVLALAGVDPENLKGGASLAAYDLACTHLGLALATLYRERRRIDAIEIALPKLVQMQREENLSQSEQEHLSWMQLDALAHAIDAQIEAKAGACSAEEAQRQMHFVRRASEILDADREAAAAAAAAAEAATTGTPLKRGRGRPRKAEPKADTGSNQPHTRKRDQ